MAKVWFMTCRMLTLYLAAANKGKQYPNPIRRYTTVQFNTLTSFLLTVPAPDGDQTTFACLPGSLCCSLLRCVVPGEKEPIV